MFASDGYDAANQTETLPDVEATFASFPSGYDGSYHAITRDADPPHDILTEITEWYRLTVISDTQWQLDRYTTGGVFINTIYFSSTSDYRTMYCVDPEDPLFFGGAAYHGKVKFFGPLHGQYRYRKTNEAYPDWTPIALTAGQSFTLDPQIVTCEEQHAYGHPISGEGNFALTAP